MFSFQNDFYYNEDIDRYEKLSAKYAGMTFSVIAYRYGIEVLAGRMKECSCGPRSSVVVTFDLMRMYLVEDDVYCNDARHGSPHTNYKHSALISHVHWIHRLQWHQDADATAAAAEMITG